MLWRWRLSTYGRRVAVSSKTRREVAQRDSYRCRGCSQPYSEVHHIVYRSHGGPDTLENLICLCSACHDRAHSVAKPPIKRWELAALTKVSGADVMYLRKNIRFYHSCGTCFFYHDGVCGFFDHRVGAEDCCSTWTSPYEGVSSDD